jgi:hypothetical protein
MHIEGYFQAHKTMSHAIYWVPTTHCFDRGNNIHYNGTTPVLCWWLLTATTLIATKRQVSLQRPLQCSKGDITSQLHLPTQTCAAQDT